MKFLLTSQSPFGFVCKIFLSSLSVRMSEGVADKKEGESLDGSLSPSFEASDPSLSTSDLGLDPLSLDDGNTKKSGGKGIIGSLSRALKRRDRESEDSLSPRSPRSSFYTFSPRSSKQSQPSTPSSPTSTFTPLPPPAGGPALSSSLLNTPSHSPSLSPSMSPTRSPETAFSSSPPISPSTSPAASPSFSPFPSPSTAPNMSPPPVPHLPPPKGSSSPITSLPSHKSDPDLSRTRSISTPWTLSKDHCANSDQVMRTIKNPQSRMAFLRFLEKTMCDELLLCWEAMENFRLTWEFSLHTLRMEKATKILDQFIFDSAPRQVNVVYALRRQIIREWDAGRFDKEIFQACEDKIFTLLSSDSYLRFTQSKPPPGVQPISAEIFDVVSKGKAVAVYQAMAEGNLNVPSIDYCVNSDGLHLLHVAVNQQLLVLTEDLLQFGSNVNCRSYMEETPLHFAVKKKFYNMATLLIKYKADPNAQDSQGKSPLHFAAMKGSKTLVKMLIAAKADPFLLDNERHSPVDFAQNKKIEAMMRGN